MKRIAVDDNFEEQLFKVKNFFYEKYNIEIYGTRITQALAKMIEQGVIFPLDESSISDVIGIKSNNKVREVEIHLKMRVPIRNGNAIRYVNSNVNNI